MATTRRPKKKVPDLIRAAAAELDGMERDLGQVGSERLERLEAAAFSEPLERFKKLRPTRH